MESMKRLLVPRTLTWDKLAALYAVTVLVLKTTLDHVRVVFEEEVKLPDGTVPPETYDYDIDVVVVYNRTPGLGSALEKVAKENGLLGIPGMRHLVELLAENNRTGSMKRTRQSLVGLIRDAYEVGRNVDFTEHRMNIIQMMWPVLDAYFAAARESDHVGNMSAPFALNGYRKLLELAGADPQTIVEAIRPLDDLFERAKQRGQRTRERVPNIQPEHTFGVRVNGSSEELAGHLVVTDDRLVLRSYFAAHPECVALVTRRRDDGRYAIFVRGEQDLSGVFNALEEIYPGMFFLDQRPRSPMILNGSASRYAAPCPAKPWAMIRIVGENFIYEPEEEGPAAPQADPSAIADIVRSAQS